MVERLNNNRYNSQSLTVSQPLINTETDTNIQNFLESQYGTKCCP